MCIVVSQTHLIDTNQVSAPYFLIVLINPLHPSHCSLHLLLSDTFYHLSADILIHFISDDRLWVVKYFYLIHAKYFCLTFFNLLPGELLVSSGGSLHDVGEPDPKAQQFLVILRVHRSWDQA